MHVHVYACLHISLILLPTVHEVSISALRKLISDKSDLSSYTANKYWLPAYAHSHCTM